MKKLIPREIFIKSSKKYTLFAISANDIVTDNGDCKSSLGLLTLT